jgi:hypothetical protein
VLQSGKHSTEMLDTLPSVKSENAESAME